MALVARRAARCGAWGRTDEVRGGSDGARISAMLPFFGSGSSCHVPNPGASARGRGSTRGH